MAAAISFAVGGIVNQTSGTVNAPGNLATVLSFLPFFLLLSLPQSVYRVYICIHLCRARACVCVCVCVLAQVRGMHERKCCEENVGEKRGMDVCTSWRCVYKVDAFQKSPGIVRTYAIRHSRRGKIY